MLFSFAAPPFGLSKKLRFPAKLPADRAFGPVRKEQLLRPIGQPSSDPALAELEQRVRNRINDLGMGPMGIGGRNYCLAVHIKEYPTHLAGLPVAVNYCCHALRHSETII